MTCKRPLLFDFFDIKGGIEQAGAKECYKTDKTIHLQTLWYETNM
jgi:hypothetical protein